jgi:hypothetical protein
VGAVRCQRFAANSIQFSFLQWRQSALILEPKSHVRAPGTLERRQPTFVVLAVAVLLCGKRQFRSVSLLFPAKPELLCALALLLRAQPRLLRPFTFLFRAKPQL